MEKKAKIMLICDTGAGMCVVSNKFKGVGAALILRRGKLRFALREEEAEAAVRLAPDAEDGGLRKGLRAEDIGEGALSEGAQCVKAEQHLLRADEVRLRLPQQLHRAREPVPGAPKMEGGNAQRNVYRTKGQMALPYLQDKSIISTRTATVNRGKTPRSLDKA